MQAEITQDQVQWPCPFSCTSHLVLSALSNTVHSFLQQIVIWYFCILKDCCRHSGKVPSWCLYLIRLISNSISSYYFVEKWVSKLSIINILNGFPHSSVGKESACNAGDPSSIPGWGRSTGEGIGYLLQYSWASLAAHLVKNLRAMQETWVQSLGWEDPPEKGKATHSSNICFPGGSDGKESVYNLGDLGSIPWLGRTPGRGQGNPFQSSWLENYMDRGAWLQSMGHKELDMTERLRTAQYSENSLNTERQKGI